MIKQLPKFEPKLTDTLEEVDQYWNETVEWIAGVITQYTTSELWSMNYMEVMRIGQRAEQVQKSKIAAMRKQSRKHGRY